MRKIQGGYELGSLGSVAFTIAAGYGMMSFVFDVMRMLGVF